MRCAVAARSERLMPEIGLRPVQHSPVHRRGVTLRIPRARLGRRVTLGFRGAAAALLTAVGIIHLNLAPVYFHGVAYVGVLFLATAIVAWLTALAVLVGLRGAWVLGGATCAGALAGLVASATVGLPGGFTDSLSAPGAMLSLVTEGSYIALYGLAVSLRRNLLLELPDRA